MLVEPLTGYKFEDVATITATSTATSTSNSNSYNGYSSIPYDAKIKIIKDTSKTGVGAHIEVDDNSGLSGSNFDLNNNTSYIFDINNGKENTSNPPRIDNALEIVLKDSLGNPISGAKWTPNKNSDSGNDANIIVQVDSNEQNASNIGLNINCYNKIGSSTMYVYSSKVKDTTLPADFNKDVVNCSISNQQGKVNTYSNIYNKSDNVNVYSDTDTRVYKIIVRLFKDGQNTDPQNGDKPINQVVTYKTVQY